MGCPRRWHVRVDRPQRDVTGGGADSGRWLGDHYDFGAGNSGPANTRDAAGLTFDVGYIEPGAYDVLYLDSHPHDNRGVTTFDVYATPASATSSRRMQEEEQGCLVRRLDAARGGNLVTVRSKAMAQHIDATYVRASGSCHATWIGLNDRAREDRWVRANGDAVGYTNWWRRHGEPNNMGGGTGEDCASLGVDCIYGFDGVGDKWADSGCEPGHYEYRARASATSSEGDDADENDR